MNLKQTFLLALACAALLSGCASGPDYKTYTATLAPVSADEGRIWFYRPSKLLGAAVQPAVKLNGEPVGRAQPGSFFHVERRPGDYEVKCTTEWSHKQTISLTPQSVKYIRLGMMIGAFVGHVIPKEVDETTALKELEKCRLLSGFEPGPAQISSR